MSSIMPTVPVDELKKSLNDDEMDLIKRICSGKRLKASKPKVAFVRQGRIRIDNVEDAQAAYLWGYCAYYISPYKIHAAYLPSDRWIKDAERLREIGDMICQSVPQEQWYGLISRGEK